VSPTPGPWQIRFDVCRDHPESSPDVFGPNAQFVASCGCHEQANANARLIAAAPDLLEAVKAARDEVDCVIETDSQRWLEFIAQLEAAIAKAEVESLGERATYVRMSDGRTLARLGNSDEVGIGEGNARLIAAAPELYDALKRLHETGLVRELGTPENAAALAAIAKAEGR